MILYIINDSYKKQNSLTQEIMVTKAKTLLESIEHLNKDKREHSSYTYKMIFLKNTLSEFEDRGVKYLKLNPKENFYYEFIDDKLNFIGKVESNTMSIEIDIADEIVKMEDIKKNKNLLYVVVIVLIILLLIRLFVFMNRLNRDKKQLIKVLQDDKKIQERMLIQQSKMASMGEMIGVIAHQWKQPLNALSLLIYDTKDAYEFGDLDENYLNETIEKSTFQIEFMSKTIDDFRNFFNPSKKRETFSVKSAILDVLNILNSQFKKFNIEIKIEESESNNKIDGFENEFKQVVLNILNNAKDAILSQKEKKLLNKSSGLIHISIERVEANLIIKFIDNGGGMPDSVIENLFKPYITTKGENGTGIGLYISKIIVGNIGGSIKAYNLNDGACFEIVVPVREEE